MSFAEFVRDRRGLVFAVPAGALAVLVIVAAMNLDRGPGGKASTGRLDNAEDLLAPRAANAEELERATSSIADQTAVSLASGAWIQVADESGRLAQQYSATKLDPMPGNQLSMTEPRSLMYMKDGRVLALAARKGMAFVPRRALESGTLEGDVEVRLFKPKAGAPVDPDRDSPAMIVTADLAQFDSVAGEVRCDRAVRVASDLGSFAGEGLSLVLDADGDGVERLVVDRALEPIRMNREMRAQAASERAAAGDAERVSAGEADPGPSPETPASTRRSKREESPFYRLVLMGGVEVVRMRGGVASVIRGEELVAVFSLDSQGLDDLAVVPASHRRDEGLHDMNPATDRSVVSTLAGPTALAVGALAFAQPGALQDSSSEGVTISFGGKLVMLPAGDPADQLATKDDIRIDVVGPRVEAVDGRTASRIVCSRLRYSVRDERVEAEGRAGAPLVVVNPRMRLEGERFWANLGKAGDAAGAGRLEGPGRIAFARGGARSVSMLGDFIELSPGLVLDASRMLVSADPAAAAMISAAPAQSTPPVAEPRFDPSAQELEIKWQGGVDLRFAGDGDDAKLSTARFVDGVQVLGRQFEMDAGSLEVAFSPNDAERIDAIIADGGTKIRRLGADGGMSAGRLELFLGANAAGDSIPSRLVARSAVEARDERQTIWTEDLVVSFREKPRDASSAKKSVAAAAGEALPGALPGADDSLGDVDIDTVEAKGGVQVLLKEGARVFADALVGDASRRRLRLTGENVAIVRTNVVADGMRDIRFDDASRSARSEGPGRFRAFKKPVVLPAGKVDRPDPAEKPTLDAAWSESLEYGEISDARGTLDIRGDVKVRSRPSDTSSDALDAQSILLELGIDPKARGEAKTLPDGTRDLSGAERALEHFIAKGGARLESRTWPTSDRSGEPRVFRVSGEHVEYDLRTREGLVVGDGTILVNIPPPADAKAVNSKAADARPVAGAGPAGSLALGVDGTTRFRWKRRMGIESLYEDVFRITMESEVEMLHAGLRADDTMSMRCDTLEATVRRPLDRKDTVKAEDGTDAPRGVDLGGPAELQGLRGAGNVFIRTPEQDIECGEFDYSVATGVATLSAAEGRTVTISVKGQPAPIRAQQVVWDLRNGRLQVSKVSGAGGR